ncbi:tRNA dimethylallyltransferase [Chionoecetes opilio]|uniref:tRNA dimethylallyltransferase n=1 Tax=Chionoecetes opilio TaxID=41210 RepID=A0A8J4YAZ2_CHIOP|nr:tRNA dimethylallyltransferase [Chionoecetes opilio]
MSIHRSLQVWEQTGRPHSQLLEAQREQEGGSGLGGALRYPEAVILWVTCEQEVLLARLDARVEEMLARGLVKELLDFHAAYNTRRLREGGTQDYTKGIFQSIGFKEFHDFLVLPEGEREGEEGRRLYEAGVAAMKLATRQYTKRQLRWIKNRFLTPSDRKVPPLYMLDATDPTQWETRVGGPAQAVVQAMVEGRVPDLKPANPQSDPDGAGKPRNNKSRHECEVCGRVLIGEHIWQDHLRGAKHRKMLKRKAQQQQAKLKDFTYAHEFAVAVSNRFDVLGALEDPVELWDTFKRETLQAAKECIGERPRSRRGFVSTETLEKIEESRAARLAGNRDQHRAVMPD